MNSSVNTVTLITSSGSLIKAYIRTSNVRFNSLSSGATSVRGSKSYELQDGQHLNPLDDDCFVTLDSEVYCLIGAACALKK